MALYCSDVSGAFDRVRATRLQVKLQRSGLHRQVVALLESWLEERECTTLVGGNCSDRQILRNSVYQGTVWGPPLWNIHFSDARAAVQSVGFEEVIFADDLHCDRSFPSNTNLEQVWAAMENCQVALHTWGRANSVRFDASKEGKHILHRRLGTETVFRNLGITFDTKLTMCEATAEIAREGGWRVSALLKSRRYFTSPELMQLYKSQVLCRYLPT